MSNPDGTPNGDAGGNENVTLSKQEYDKLINERAEAIQAKVSLTDEVTGLRQKNRELTQDGKIETEDVDRIVEQKLKERDAESLEMTKKQALTEFLDAHPELSKEEDTDGKRFAAFQGALSKLSLGGVKTKEDYNRVLSDAMRLIEGQVEPTSRKDNMNPSTPPSYSTAPSSKPGARVSDREMRLVNSHFNGDVETYLKKKAKHPILVEELLNYVR